MKCYTKKIISAFIAMALAAAGSVNCMLVGAEDLPNSTSVPYDENKAAFYLDEEHGGTMPEVTMGIDLEGETPPSEYDLTLEWGNMSLKYTFTTDSTGALTGGNWGNSFDQTNNKIVITNNNTSQEITGYMTYTNTPETRPEGSEELDDYDVGITLARYDETASSYKDFGYNKQFTLAVSGADGNSVDYYIYDQDDLYTKVFQEDMPTPTESIAELKVGVITVQATFREG